LGGFNFRNGEDVKTPHPEAIQAIDPVSETTRGPKAPLVAPTLASYFGAKPVPVGAFFKVVRDSQVGRFADTDVEEAATQMGEYDGDCRRLLALASQSGRPDAVERWLWPAVQRRLKDLVPGEFDPFGMDAASTLRTLRRQLSGLLESKEPAKRKRSEAVFMLGLKWLASQRALDAWAALDEIRLTFLADGKQTSSVVRRILASGRLADVKNAAAIAGLASDLVQEARKLHDAETRRQVLLRSELDAAQAEIAALKATVEELAKERDASANRAERTASLLKDSEQHWGHDMADLRARQRVFLKERLGPELNDAIDALEIEPPVPQIAVSRLKSALASIQEASK
jgi:hypothetical protein